jgi:hypothetical protein
LPLLGWPLETLLALVLVLVMAGTLFAWSRVRGGRVLANAQRLAMLLASQAVAVLLLAAAVNNYGYFYGSWGDLFGTNTQAALSTNTPRWPHGHFGKTGATIPAASVTGQTDWSVPGADDVRGKIEDVHIRGARSGLQGDALIYLPPQYYQPAYAHHAFPAVEVLTGYPGITANLVSRMHYPGMLLTELQQNRAHPMVLVMLRPTVAPPRDTECTDVPGGPQAMTYLSQDVPAAIDALVRVRPTGWGAMGDSTGGYCAVKIAMAHSDVFGAAASLSGYYHTLKDSTTGDLWGGSNVLRDLNSPEWVMAHQPQPPISVLATVGLMERGNTGYQDTRRFLSLVRPPMTASSIFIPGGGHNFASWAKVMPTALDWLSQKLQA